MKHLILKTAPLIMAALIGQHAYSQAPAALPSEIEGPIDSVRLLDNGTVVMRVMGIRINVRPGTPIASPTAALSLQQLADPTPLPGRTQEGFERGTAIVIGTTNAAGVITADDVFVEPAENVVVGVVTENTGGTLQLNGMPVSFLADPRIPAAPLKNAFGFEILASSVLPGTPASVEGYYAGGVFNAFLMEVEGNAQLANPNPQISVLRADSRERTPNNERGDEVDVRGAITAAHVAPGVTTQTIRVFRVDNGVQRALGTTIATLDPATPGFASWNFRIATTPTNNVVLGSTPTLLRARNISPGANNVTVEAVPTVRLD
ncbi:MAG: hypothetical protein EOP84_15355 [Verrucomicrobiaceae bacterium]|nr:MAG: hypothetical protein EOP84_15355 [Verrucomicrobiaceae bacterium]